MSYQNQLPGIEVADHRRLGREFEQDLISTHSVYERRGAAKIDRHPSEWEFIGAGEYRNLSANPKTRALVAVTGNGVWMKRRATNVDFSGVAKINTAQFGLHVKFDAKMSKGDSIALGNFKKHQVENLCVSARCGAIAGFMINFYEPSRVFFCPATFVRKKIDKNFGKLRAAPGDGCIRIAELETEAVEIPYSRRFIDWLPVLIKPAASL